MRIGDKIWLLNVDSFEVFSAILDEQDYLVKWYRCKDIIIYYSEKEAKDSLKRIIDNKIKYHKSEIERLELIKNDKSN